eukprot:5896842-Prorocentrum_lima.AAC.1
MDMSFELCSNTKLLLLLPLASSVMSFLLRQFPFDSVACSCTALCHPPLLNLLPRWYRPLDRMRWVVGGI